MRVFSAGGTRDDFTRRYLSTTPDVGVSLQNHLEMLWPEGYCLAVNDVSCWSHTIHEYVSRKFVDHWISRYGESVGGLDVYAFIGRYELTPFGIHKDDEDSYLFNLGPAPKTVRLWGRDDLIDQFGTDAVALPVFRYDVSDPRCQSIDLHPGDGILIPRGVYHILESPGYTVMLGVAPYLPSMSSLLNSAICRYLGGTLADIKFDDYGADIEKLTSLEDGFSSAMETASVPDLKHSLHADLLLLKSNAFIRGSSVPEDRPFDENTEYVISSGGEIQRLQINGRLFVFVRGHELSFAGVSLVEHVLDALHELNFFTVNSLFHTLSGKVSRKVLVRLLSALYDCCGICERESH